MFSSRFMLFPTFQETIFPGVGGVQKCMVLASEPVGGRSRATELPCGEACNDENCIGKEPFLVLREGAVILHVGFLPAITKLCPISGGNGTGCY